MKVVAYERIGGKVHVFDAAQIVVYDDFGNPLSIALEFGHSDMPQQFVSKVGDPDFDRTLKIAGVDKTVICTEYRSAPPKDGSVLIASPGG